ncbi:FirrV-1-B12 precursor [Feldmannia irregularis virus a]|uniref:FirrV-1-B12 n=1 Tax=Feldmannia irregularis virus a TaxID=231992 RepID=Q6XM24_9PHYC|nr:FirrV-1-B12 precursor [Feldmannia irregularis virus a]AAR26887.1 FirrV-1-B12 precursor [Feldmannia irregularis virus a]
MSAVTPEERNFFWTWTRTRYLEDVYTVLALTIWIRAKRYVIELRRVHAVPREVCMIICIHISMKYLGYDELFACRFRDDLLPYYCTMTAKMHEQLEYKILRALDWTIEDLGVDN